MQKMNVSPNTADAIVMAEFQAMLARCEEAGISPEKVRSTLSMQFFIDDVERSAANECAREALARHLGAAGG